MDSTELYKRMYLLLKKLMGRDRDPHGCYCQAGDNPMLAGKCLPECEEMWNCIKTYEKLEKETE